MQDIVMYGLLGVWVTLVGADLLVPARRFPAIKRWRGKGVLFFVLGVALSMVLPLLWDEWLGAHRLVDGSGLGTVGGAIVGLLVLQLGVYWWHRALHRVPLLWRSLHQMHHSAERLDVFGAFYFHPLDVAGFAFVYSFTLVMVAGVNAEAAFIANAIATFCSIFQHANLRTPRWLGYLVQRPESHGIHHQRGVHAFNYGDIPIWDMVFGTFRNPARFEGDCGLYDGASQRLGALLLGRDVERAAGGSGGNVVGATRV